MRLPSVSKRSPSILSVLACVWIVAVALISMSRLTFPLELEWMEGGSVLQALRFQRGLPLYPEPSAADVAKLIVQIRKEGISAYFVETITDNRLVDQIGRETGAKRGGTLYSGALSGPGGPAPTYLDMVRHNATTIAQALRP